MAPTLSILLPRQFGDNNGDRNGNDGPPGDNNTNNNNNGGVSKWAFVGVAIAAIVVSAILTYILRRLRLRSRRRAATSSINLATTTPYKPNTTLPANADPTKYNGTAGGYTATVDQNHSLLNNAEAPAIVMWEPDNASSTQDGFGYDNNLHLAGAGIQRPASIASFSAPPPRYEDVTNSSAPGNSAGRRPGSSSGEAASYFNTSASMGEDARGRSRSMDRGGEGERGRALSTDARSINADRRRSMSRFREEGMVDVSVGKS